MTLHAFRRTASDAVPVPLAGPWQTRADALGPCRTMAGQIVAMVYPTPSGRWAWVTGVMGRITSKGDDYATEAESRERADLHLSGSGVVLA